MFEKILIPLDGSEFAEAALPYGEQIGRIFRSEVVLLHVCAQECRNYEHMHKIYMDTLVKTFGYETAESLTQNAEFKVSTKIEEGNPLESIGTFVEKNCIDLIIMTSAASSGHKAGTLGTVADHISRTVKIPVLLVKARLAVQNEKEKPTIKRVIVTLDGSDLSKRALPVAEALAARLQIPMTLFQMARDIHPYYGEPVPFVDYREMAADEVKKVGAELSVMEEEFRKKGQIVDWEVASGSNAAQEIIEMSKKIANCLLVMSTHGRSGLGRWAMGSVADKVLHHVEVPLLLVPAGVESGH
jgi:nucleotide-binding universal stress UspA family protein